MFSFQSCSARGAIRKKTQNHSGEAAPAQAFTAMNFAMGKKKRGRVPRSK
jgi:hypothetical protein